MEALVGGYVLREVRTQDDYVKGSVRKFEIVKFEDLDAFDPISSHYDEDEARREARRLAMDA